MELIWKNRNIILIKGTIVLIKGTIVMYFTL